ncbi:MCE family protein [Nocardioides immobilis]|uniref:MCE family protein n=1 Tax=Nocardioides immobilis TaxID=2049295 RepID=A0A417XZ89_9ACTN|nr:MCE family protein [Nocardioides immobilis]RHW25675.1 MCE family protein [Nocardioides immobilis]
MKGASPLIKKQLIAFGIASVIGIVALAMTFLRVPETLGFQRYEVDVEFRQAAGLYEGAEVTYLGHPVGKVKSMKVKGDRLVARLNLATDTDIPSDVSAEIHSRSAVGEQYVDLVPVESGEAEDATLADGDLIPLERTSAPVEIGPVLDNVYALVESLDEKQLATLLRETSAGLNGRTGELQTILDASAEFISLADANFEQTAALIRDAGPLLETINGKSENIGRLTQNLAQVTAELRAGDADIRALLDRGPEFADTTNVLLDDLETDLPPLLTATNTVSRVLNLYDPYLRQILSDYPLAVATVQSVTMPALDDKAVRLSLANFDDPPECIEGFVPPEQWASPFDTSPRKNPLVFCKAPHDDPRAVRGARKSPAPRVRHVARATRRSAWPPEEVEQMATIDVDRAEACAARRRVIFEGWALMVPLALSVLLWP